MPGNVKCRLRAWVFLSPVVKCNPAAQEHTWADGRFGENREVLVVRRKCAAPNFFSAFNFQNDKIKNTDDKIRFTWFLSPGNFASDLRQT